MERMFRLTEEEEEEDQGAKTNGQNPESFFKKAVFLFYLALLLWM